MSEFTALSGDRDAVTKTHGCMNVHHYFVFRHAVTKTHGCMNVRHCFFSYRVWGVEGRERERVRNTQNEAWEGACGHHCVLVLEQCNES